MRRSTSRTRIRPRIYLFHSFPTQLFEPFTDGEGDFASRPAFPTPAGTMPGAVARRDRMMEHLAALTVRGALDQIVRRLGKQQVARSPAAARRIIRKGERLCVEGRAVSANLAEREPSWTTRSGSSCLAATPGGTGRSYSADRAAGNRRFGCTIC